MYVEESMTEVEKWSKTISNQEKDLHYNLPCFPK